MSEPLVLVRDEGFVRWLTLNRPQHRNSLNAALVTALGEQLADPGDARCIAITGAGKAFSAGADLKALQAMRTAGFEENLADSQHLADLYRRIAAHHLPVIAAVNGPALGGGAGLAVACDVVYAAREAVIGFPEVRIGFVPAIVMNFLLRTVGEKVARDLCLTGRRLAVDEAQTLGLIAKVVDPAELTRAVADLAGEIAQASPQAVAETKRLFVELSGLPLAEGLERAAAANARARQTEECREGMDAFLEKRRPRWIR
jgi:methylglutaconyl-CoA hydratase